jgi:hypothetical protein
VLEAETTISKLDIMEQHYRHVVAKTVKKIIQENSKNNIRNKREWKLIANIRNKLA